MKKLGKALGAVAAVGAVAAGGSALTTSNALPAYNIAGYASSSVTGVTVTEIDYTLSVDGDMVTALAITTNGDTDHITVGVSFGEDVALQDCAAGVHDGVGNVTNYACDITDVATTTANDLNIAATETA